MGFLSTCVVYLGFGVDLFIVYGFIGVFVFGLFFAFVGEYFYWRK